VFPVADSVSNSIDITANDWKMIAVVFDQINLSATLYYDGQVMSVSAYHPPSSSSANLTVGGSACDVPGFVGLVDNLFVYSTALTVQELSYLDRADYAPVVVPAAGSAGYALQLVDPFVVRIPATPAMSTFGEFRISAWIQLFPTAASMERVILEKGTDSVNEYRLSISDDIPGDVRRLKVLFGSGTNSVTWLVPLGGLNSYWQHVAVSWDGTVITAYLNNSMLAQQTWTSAVGIVDVGGDLWIGKSHIANNYINPLFGLIDSVCIWNSSQPAVSISSVFNSNSVAGYDFSPSPADRNLVLYLPFNEGTGFFVGSQTLESDDIGMIVPNYDEVNSVSANQLWKQSPIPLDDKISLLEQQYVLLQLNYSYSGDDSTLIEVTTLPAFGQLFMLSEDSSSVSDVAISAVGTVDSATLYYRPFINYNGDDSFSFKVYTGSSTSSQVSGVATVQLKVLPMLTPVPLTMDSLNLTLTPFQIVDGDAVGTNTMMSVRLDLESAEEQDSSLTFENAKLSLATSQNLLFTDIGNGPSSGTLQDVISFNATQYRATSAVSSLQIHYPVIKNGTANHTLIIRVDDNDVIAPATAQYELPIQLKFSSVPEISSVNPAVVANDADATIDVIGSFFDNDVVACAVGTGIVVPALIVSDNTIRCNFESSVMASATGLLPLVLVTKAGVYSNSLQVSVFPTIVPVLVTPSNASSAGNSFVNISFASSAVPGSLFCLFGNDKYVQPMQVRNTFAVCAVPSSDSLGSVSVALTYNTLQTADLSLSTSIEYIAPLAVFYVQPSIVDVRWSGTITMHGFGFENGWLNASCHVPGYVGSYLTIVNDSVATCSIVAMDHESTVGSRLEPISAANIAVAWNGADLVDSGVSLYFKADPTVLAMSPLSGSAAGNTRVTVYGVNFDASLGLTCIFSDKSTSVMIKTVFISETELQCVSPPASGFTNSSVYLTLGVYESPIDWEQIFVYNYLQLPTSLTMPLSYAPAGGVAVKVPVVGKYFDVGVYSQKCIWRSSPVAGADMISDFEVVSSVAGSCWLPVNMEVGTYSVSVTPNEVDEVTVTESFVVFESAAIDVVFPVHGPVGGGTLVNISGSFPGGVDLPVLCRFDGITAVPQSVSTSLISCHVPSNSWISSSAPASVLVEVLVGPYAFSNVDVKFFLDEMFMIESIAPLGGSVSGGTLLTITGTGFSVEAVPTCRFGALVVPATIISSTTLTCTSPSQLLSATGAATVSVSMNGVDYGTHGLTFQYWAPASVNASASTAVVYAGVDSAVTVVSQSSWPVLAVKPMCVINGLPVGPLEILPAAIICGIDSSVSSYATGSVNVGLMFNGVDAEVSWNVAVLPSAVFSLAPLAVPARSSSVLNLTLQSGRAVVAAVTAITCSFDNSEYFSVATYSADGNNISCRLPASMTSGSASIQILLDGVPASAAMPFYVYEVPRAVYDENILTGIVNTTSSFSFQLADSYDIANQSGLLAAITVSCSIMDLVYVGRYVDGNTVICSNVTVATVGYHMLHFSMNGVNYHKAGVIEILADSGSVAMYPPQGSVTGGTPIHFYGYPWDQNSQYTCEFQFSSRNGVEVVAATDGLSLICVSPSAATPSQAFLTVTVEGTLILNRTYTFIPDPVVQSLEPGTVTAVERFVTVTASGLDCAYAGCFCKFAGVVVGAAAFNETSSVSTEVLCPLPSQLEVGPVTVGVSANGVDFVSANSALTIHTVPNVVSVSPSFGVVSVPAMIVLSGANFVPGMSCSLGRSIVASTFLSSSSISCSFGANSSATGTFIVKLSVNGVNWLNTGITFSYLSVPVVASLQPSLGPELGGTQVFFTGQGLGSRSTQIKLCSFGDTTKPVLAQWESDSIISCIAPGNAPRTVTVQLSIDGSSWFDAGKFTYYITSSVFDVSPDSIGTSGGEVITLRVNNIFSSGSMCCLFVNDDTVVAAAWINITAVSCVAPAGVIGAHVVEFSNNCVDFTSSQISVQFASQVSVSRASPLLGPSSTSTLVYFETSNIGANMKAMDVNCNIGGIVSTALQFSKGLYICMVPTPGDLTVSSIPIDISVQGSAPAAPRFTFQYYSEPRIFSVWPPTVTDAGESNVYLLGENFLQTSSLRCMFDNMVTSAFAVSSTMVSCELPPRTPGTVTVRVSINGQDFSSDVVVLSVVPQYSVTAVVPALVSQSLSEYVIPTMSIPKFDGMICQFGELVTIPVQTDTRVMCPVPAELPLGVVDFKVTSYGAEGDVNVFSLSVIESPTVDSISPVHGYVSLSTILYLTGENFVPGMKCMFGTVFSVSVYSNATSVACPVPKSSGAGTVPLLVSVNGVNWLDSGLMFTYLPLPVTTSVFPAFGPESGGTMVTIRGTGFSPLAGTQSVLCLFGNNSAQAVAGTWDSDSAITCTSSGNFPTTVTVRISLDNGLNWIRAGIFKYVPVEKISSLVPAATVAGTTDSVTVFGDGFLNVNSLMCRLNDTYVSSATFINASAVSCSITSTIGRTKVSVSNNGINFGLSYAYLVQVGPAQIVNLAPLNGPSFGGNVLTITGSGFSSFNTASIHLAGATFSGSVLSDSALIVSLPPFSIIPQRTNVTVVFDGYYIPSVQLSYNLVNVPPVLAVSPLAGPDDGGWSVHLSVPGASRLGSVFCRFSGIAAINVRVLGDLIECVAPRFPSIGDFSVELSTNNIDFVPIATVDVFPKFSYFNVAPATVVVGSPTTLSITGTGFHSVAADNVCCEIGGVTFTANVSSGEQVSCIISPMLEGTQQVRIVACDAFVPYDLATKQDNMFLTIGVTEGSIVRLITPISGFVSGGTTVSIVGDGFGMDSAFNCGFSSGSGAVLTVSAVRVSRTLLVCTSPAMTSHVKGTVFVTANDGYTSGSNYSSSRVIAQSPFGYVSEIDAIDAAPLFGSESGGTEVSVRLASSVSSFSKPMCKFGMSSSVLAVARVMNNSGVIVCRTPASLPSIVEIYVSPNGVDFVQLSGLSFMYVPKPSVTSIVPSLVTNLTTAVTVVGSNLHQAGMRCGFGKFVTTAILINDTAVSCPLPQYWSATAYKFEDDLLLSVNGIDFENMNVTIQRLSSPSKIFASPMIGRAKGGTNVVVSAAGLSQHGVAAVFCRFGSAVVPATVIDPNTATCLSPAFTLPVGASSYDVNLGVSIDGGYSYFRTTESKFVYVADPKLTAVSSYLVYLAKPTYLRLFGSFSVSASTSEAGCRIGTIVSPVFFISDSELLCSFTLFQPGQFQVGFTYNGQDYVENMTSATVAGVPSIESASVIPSSTFSSSTSQISVSFVVPTEVGAQLLNQALLCNVNGTFFAGIMSVEPARDGAVAASVTCNPSFTDAGVYAVTVRMVSTGQDILDGPVFVKVYQLPTISGLRPSFVTLAKTAAVALHGSFGDPDQYRCAFGLPTDLNGLTTLVASPKFANRSLVECGLGEAAQSMLTRSLSGAQTVLVGLGVEDGAAMFLSSVIVFEPISIKSVYPDVVLTDMQFTVVVAGANFRQTMNSMCRLGENTFPAVLVNESAMSCQVFIATPGIFTISLTVDGSNYVEFSNAVTVVEKPVMDTDAFAYCPLHGSSVGLVFSGVGFDALSSNNLALQCSFYGLVTSVRFVSPSQVACGCPSYGEILSVLTQQKVWSPVSVDEVPVSLLIVGTDNSLFSTSFSYYEFPSSLIVGPTALVENVATTVIVTLTNLSLSDVTSLTPKYQIDSVEQTMEAQQINSSSFACLVTCSVDTGASFNLLVAFDGMNYQSVGTLQCALSPTIISLKPSQAPELGGSSVTAFVNHGVASDSITCQFGDLEVAASSMVQMFGENSAARIVCRSPPHAIGSVDFTLRIGTMISDSVRFDFIATAAIVSHSPQYLTSSEVSQKVDFSVINIPANTVVRCTVSADSVTQEVIGAVSTDSTSVTCPVILGQLSLRNVLVSVFLDDVSIGSSNITVTSVIDVASLSPAAGSISGGYYVYAKISAPILLGQQVWCSVGGVVSSSTVVTETTVACLLANVSAPEYTAVGISLDGKTTGLTYPFIYFSAVILNQLSPNSGSVLGGTVVSLTGTGFESFVQYQCMFGTKTVLAQYISLQTIRCAAPSAETIFSVPVVVLVNGNLVSVVASARVNSFRYHAEPAVAAFSPKFGSLMGNEEVNVTVTGVNLVGLASSPVCMFGSVLGLASVVSPTVIQCITPLSRTGGSVTLSISLNGVEFYPATGVSFQYVASMTVLELSPWHGSVKGGYFVDVVGLSFPQVQDLTCGFGATLTNAIWLSASLVKCIVPSAPHPEIVTFSLSSPTMGLSAQWSFQYDLPYHITTVKPNYIAVYNGPSRVVNITGSGFYRYPELGCRVGGTMTAALFVSSNQIKCSLPELVSPGVSLLEITLNGRTFDAAIALSVKQQMVVYSVTPSVGVSSGYEAITVLGSGFSESISYSCLFNDMVMSAEFVNSTAVSCLTSPISQDYASVSLKIRDENSSVISANDLTFEYIPPCLLDHYSPPALSVGATNQVEIYLQTPSFSMISRELGIVCEINGSSAPAISLNLERNSVVCAVPSNLQAPSMVFYSTATVALSFGGAAFLYLKEPIMALSKFDVDSIYPKILGAGFPATVTVAGGLFNRNVPYSCKLLDEIFESRWISDSSIECVDVVSSVVGVAPLYVSSNRIDWVTSLLAMGAVVDVVPVATLASMSPSVLPAQLGVRTVQLAGFGFSASSGDDVANFVVQLRSTMIPTFVTVAKVTEIVNDTIAYFDMPDWTPLEYVIDAKSDSVVATLMYRNAQCGSSVLIVHPMYEVNIISPLVGVFEGLSPMSLSVSAPLDPTLSYRVVFHHANPNVNQSSVSLVPFVLNNSQVLMVSTPAYIELDGGDSFDGVVFVTLQASNGFAATSAAPFNYLRPMVFDSIVPSSILEVGGSVKIYGTNIPTVALVSCAFDGVIVAASRLDSAFVECPAPAHIVGSVTVRVSPNNGVDWVTVATNLTYFAMPENVVVRPTSGPVLGGTNLTITGVNLEYLQAGVFPFCKFNALEVVATFLPLSNALSCMTPPMAAGQIDVSVIVRRPNGKQRDIVASNLSFLFYEDILLESVYPKEGPSFGGTAVRIYGSGFLDSLSLCAKFQSNSSSFVIVPATFLSAGELLVYSPPNPNGAGRGFASVSISNNGVDFTFNTILFYWENSIMITSMISSNIFESGGQVIDVVGDGFYQSFPNMLRCLFNDNVSVPAMYISENKMRCSTPPLLPGVMKLDVSANGLDFVTAGNVNVLPVPEIRNIVPSEGPWFGGTLVRVLVNNLPPNGRFECVFGTATAPATVMDPVSGLLSCPSPPSKQNISSYVPVTVNYVQSSLVVIGGSNTSFHYLQYPNVFGVQNSFGPTSGGTNVHFFGEFEVDVDVYCHFIPDGAADAGEITMATVVSSNEVICYSAPLNLSTELVRHVPMYLSYNGADILDTGFVFEYYVTPVITGMSVTSGPQTGGVSVTLYVSRLNSYPAAVCQFGQNVVEATISSYNTVQCVLPPSDSPGDVTVGLSLNGINFVYSNISFRYFPGAGIYRLRPNFGTVSGGTAVTVFGENFDRQYFYYCSFGSIAVRADVLSASQVR
jgi:hypothetical protein